MTKKKYNMNNVTLDLSRLIRPGHKPTELNNPMVTYSGDSMWYSTKGYIHREDGPAIIYASGNQVWMLDSIAYTFDDYCEKLGIRGEDKLVFALHHGV